MGRTAMSTRELERGRVLDRVVAGELSVREAAALMRVCYRQAKRLVARYRTGGAAALQHRLVGRPSNRARPQAEREAILAFVAAELSGSAARGPGQRFGPTLAAEHVTEELAVPIATSTLRRWMQTAGLWSRQRSLGIPRQRRQRAAHFGELVQLDGSPHAWFEDRGPACCLLEMVDDATGRTLQYFAEGETSEAVVQILRQWVVAYGIPQAIYLDGAPAYRAVDDGPVVRRSGPTPGSRFGRLCATLGIELITAGSPQAKGRVERAHGTHQDRLVKKMRRYGLTTIADANAYLRHYTPQHNARFSVAPASTVDRHRPRLTPSGFDRLVQVEIMRTVGRDGVIRYFGRELQLERSVRRRVPDGARVLVQETGTGEVRVVHRTGAGDRCCAWHDAPPRTVTARPRPARATPTHAPRAAADVAAARRPHAEHPWRKTIGAWARDAMAAKHQLPRGHF